MSLTHIQVNELHTAIASYAFPATYYDFVADVPVLAANMAVVEAEIRTMLLSEEPAIAKHGLANVLYWGYAQVGYGSTRVKRFLQGVTETQIAHYQELVAEQGVPNLVQLRAIGMPQYSGISFLSKILTFLDPTNYCVLDLQLAKIGLAAGVRPLHELVIHGTTINPTRHNQNLYNAWCEECIAISNAYFDGSYRAVDIERGFFQLIQSKNLRVAQTIYTAA